MFSRYRRLFAHPGALTFVVAGTLSRLGMAMFGTACIVAIARRRDSYAEAGLLVSVTMITMALVGPWLSRRVDEFGQRRIAPPMAGITFLSGAVLAIACALRAPFAVLLVLAIVFGVRLQIGTLTRSRWVELVGHDDAQLHTANSLEQVLEEFSFVVGPVLGAWLAATLFPEAGFVLATCLYSVGLAWVGWQASPAARVVRAPGAVSAWRAPGLMVLAVLMALLGAVFGGIDVVVIAVADEAGQARFGGILLGMFALGSTVGGLVYGGLNLPGTLSRRLVVHLATLVVFMLPLRFIASLPWFGLVAAVAGLSIAPALIATMVLSQRLSPPEGLNEGMAIVMTGMLLGASIGSAVGGWGIQAAGARAAMFVPTAFALLGLIVAALTLARLSRAEEGARLRVLASRG